MDHSLPIFKEIFDISPALDENLPIWPGDAKFSAKILRSFAKGDRNQLSKFELGTHTGAHLDAPRHFFSEGASITEVPLERFMGPCEVLGVPSEDFITIDDITTALGREAKKGDNLLFKTRNSDLWAENKFQKNYVAFSDEAASYLADARINLVGIDYLSVERFQAKIPFVHRVLAREGVINLEGLNLKEVDPGQYFLVALPLKLEGLEGSPVRAVLLR